MLIKTHLAITLFVVLLLIPYTNYPLLFLAIALFSTYLPDIDSKNSKIGHYWFLRPIQWFSRHRGMIHSMSFLILATFFIALFFPFVAFAFFVGYSSHLFADSFTIEGIRPFYPSKKFSCGNIVTGSLTETNIFILFLFLDIVLFMVKSSIIL